MQSEKYTDQEIVEAIRSGDLTARNRALKQLYLDSVTTLKVKELVRTYNVTSTEAEDVLQEGIILLDQLILDEKFQGKSAIRTFLVGICRNLIRNEIKKNGRVLTKAVITDKEQLEQGDSPEDVILVQEKSEAERKREEVLQNLLAQLTDNCKAVLQLYYYQSKTMAQIATARNLKNANQAKKAASRCREQLRKLIRKQPALSNFLKQTLF